MNNKEKPTIIVKYTHNKIQKKSKINKENVTQMLNIDNQRTRFDFNIIRFAITRYKGLNKRSFKFCGSRIGIIDIIINKSTNSIDYQSKKKLLPMMMLMALHHL